MRSLVLLLVVASGCGGNLTQPSAKNDRGKNDFTGTFADSRIAQSDIDAGKFSASQLNDIGDFLFSHIFTVAEGLGNNLANVSPLAGPGARPNLRRIHNAKFGGPDDAGSSDGSRAGACSGCHLSGGEDGGGDLAHTLLQDGDGLNESSALHRNGRSLLGDGYIQQLGVEMTADLQQQLASAKQAALQSQTAQTVSLSSKGVAFGTIVVRPDGTIDSSQLAGVDADLTVKPHGWKGRLASLRRFVEGGFQVHFGMQTEVLTTKNCAKPNPLVVGNGANCQDPDNDGVISEITEGQLTAMAVYAELRQAPVRINPTDPTALQRAQTGEQLFASIGCVSCHVPSLTIKNPILKEAPDLTGGAPLLLDLTVDVEEPRLAKNGDGTVTVELFSDLKRHDMGSSLADPHATFGVVPPQLFITPPLWGIASTAPYLHDGRAPTLRDAIVQHDGEAVNAQGAFQSLSADQQQMVVEFLGTLTRDPTRTGLSPNWQERAPMPTPRREFGAATGSDGSVFVIGGLDNNQNEVLKLDVYSPSTNSWSTRDGVPAERTQVATAVAKNGHLLVIGGWNGSECLRFLFEYIPATDTWDSPSPMSTPRCGAAAVAGPDGLVYVMGGGSAGTINSSVEAYDPNTDTWRTVAPMPTARFGLAATLGSDGRIYAIGGQNFRSSALTTVEAYSPATNRWTTVAPLKQGRTELAATVGPDGNIYAMGGWDFSSSAAFSSVERFDGTAWSTVTPMPTARKDLSAVLGADGVIYAIGGTDIMSNVFATVEAGKP